MDSRVSPWLVPLAYFFVSLVLPLYFAEIEVTGQEHIPTDGPVIIAPTHRSRWDGIIVPYLTGKRVSGRHPHFMVTSSELQGLQGWVIKRLGGFAVDVEHPGLESLKHSLGLLLTGEMLVIFPEGDIYQDQKLHPLKRGVATIALEVVRQQPESNIQILPIQIQYNHYPVKWRSRVEVVIIPPVEVKEYQGKSSRKQSLKLTSALEASLSG